MPSPIQNTPARWNLNWSSIWDRIAAEVPDDVAIISPAGDLTYRDLEDRAARLAGGLARLGVRRGDAVGIFLYNRPEYLETVYAAFKIGAIPVNMNFRYRARELADLLRTSGARVLVHPVSLEKDAAKAVKRLGEPVMRLIIDDEAGSGCGDAVPGKTPYEAVLAARFDGPDERGGDDRLYVFTGGTTGLPKAVVWRHGDLLDAQSVSIYPTAGLPLPMTEAEFTAHAGAVPGEPPRLLPLAPLMHLTALVGAMNVLVLGGTIVLLNTPHLHPDEALRRIVEERITRLIVVGNAIARPLVETLDLAEADGQPFDVSSITSIVSAGMTWSDDQKAGLLRWMPKATLMDIVASTEGGPYAYSFVSGPEDLPSRIELAVGGSVIDAEGNPVAVGETGILAYSGAMPLGYLNDPVKTAEVYQDVNGVRRVSPGDYVRLLDEEGGIEFLGRGAAVVNTGGEKVYPAEVEEVALSFEGIVDAAVFGVPDPRWGQSVAAVLARKPGADVDLEAFFGFIGERLAGYKKPRHVVVVDSLERGPSGKINLDRLRSLVAEEGA